MKRFFLMSFLLFLTLPVRAEYKVSLYEIQRMPPFCRGLSISNFMPEARHLHKDIGAPGNHFQHFCHGMKYMIRAKRSNLKKNGSGKNHFKRAISEFDYVLNKKSDNKKEVLALVSMQKALALSNLDNPAEAISEFEHAITLKKNKYAYAYKKLAQYYIQLGQKDDAFTTVERGLKYNPNDKSLIKLRRKLED